LSAPLFEQLATSVRSQALDGSARAGERLPSARELAASLDINVHTVLHAYQLLRDEGLVELRPGRGAVLTAQVDTLSGLEEHVRALVAEARKVGINAATLTTLIQEAFR
jgi:DNA-binding transcriptional regulator YhcF (GntR family)